MLNQYPKLQAEGFQESDSNGHFCAGEIGANLRKLCLANSPTELPNQSKVERFKNIGSIFLQPTIIKIFGSKGNRHDLLKLKQLSKLYYQLLNPVYLNIVGKTIHIRPKDKSLDNDNSNPFKPSIWVLEDYGSVWDVSSCYVYLPPDRAQIWTWTPKLAYIFRKIELNRLWLDEPLLQIAGINLNNLISHLAPYITVLDLGKKSLNLLYNETSTNLLEFIQQFPKLKELNMHHNSIYDDWNGTPNPFEGIISLAELEVLFQGLPRSVKVNLTVCRYYEPVLERFGNVAGITILIHGLFHSAQPMIESYGYLKNVKFYVYVSIQEIVQFTSSFFKLKDKVTIACMSLNDCSNPLNETNVKQCLFQLSPFIHDLWVYGSYSQWNVFSPGICFHLLSSLSVWELQNSLDFLSGCPKLLFLHLHKLDQDLSIFHNPEKSHKDALKEYFGKLKKLKLLYISTKEGKKNRIGPGTELEAYLKQLLPNDAHIRTGGRIGVL